jgi:uncharacterized protein (DUF433 family)
MSLQTRGAPTWTARGTSSIRSASAAASGLGVGKGLPSSRRHSARNHSDNTVGSARRHFQADPGASSSSAPGSPKSDGPSHRVANTVPGKWGGPLVASVVVEACRVSPLPLRENYSTSSNIGRCSIETGYVEPRDGGYYIAGSRVSLDSVVYAFLRGESPDGIAESFPAISLEQVIGAVAFYLANRESIDTYLRDGRAEFARMRDEARRRSPAFYSRLEAARHGATTPSA